MNHFHQTIQFFALFYCTFFSLSILTFFSGVYPPWLALGRSSSIVPRQGWTAKGNGVSETVWLVADHFDAGYTVPHMGYRSWLLLAKKLIWNKPHSIHGTAPSTTCHYMVPYSPQQNNDLSICSSVVVVRAEGLQIHRRIWLVTAWSSYSLMPNDFDAHRSTEPWSVDKFGYRAGQFVTKVEEVLFILGYNPVVKESTYLLKALFAYREIDRQYFFNWESNRNNQLQTVGYQKVRARSIMMHEALIQGGGSVYRFCRVSWRSSRHTCLGAPLRLGTSLVFYVCTLIRSMNFVRHRT